MNPIIIEQREKLAKKVIDNLSKRNMTGYFAKTKEEAKELALKLIPEGSSISCGGSASVDSIELKEALNNGKYEILLRTPDDSKEEADRKAHAAFTSDVFLCSTNAISEDGILVNIDGNSNRVAAICFGPKKVIMIVGMNKIAKTEADALSRARNIAAPINAQRFPLNTPCKITGSCANCMSMDTICCQFVTTRFSRHKDRIHIILVEEDLGF